MRHEISEIRSRWRERRNSLRRADYNHADEELARTLHFAYDTPIVAAILQSLRQLDAYRDFDALAWLKGRGPAAVLGAGDTSLGLPLGERERAAQCLKVLEWAVQEGADGLYLIGNTTYGGGTSRIVDYVRSAIDTVFGPFYEFVDTELRTRETLITPSDIMKDIQSLVDSEASIRYPQTHELLLDTYKQLFSLAATSSGSSWYQIGYSCRQALVRFANEVFEPSFVPQGKEQPKGDDAREKLKWTMRHYLRLQGAGPRYGDSLEKIVDANWSFVSIVGHRQETVTEEDARLALMYTYLTIKLVTDQIEHA